MRKKIALAVLLGLTGCYEVDHDLFTISALSPINVPGPDVGALHETNVELLTGTVWKLNDERLLFFIEQGGFWRSYQVDQAGLVRIPEWSTEPTTTSDVTGSIDDYEDFASNIPVQLVAVPDGVISEFAAGKLHIVNFIYLIDDGREMAFAGRPEEQALAEYADDVEEDRIIRSEQGGIFLFDSLPQELVDALREEPSGLFPETESLDDRMRWRATDLVVPLSLDDRVGIEDLQRSL